LNQSPPVQIIAYSIEKANNNTPDNFLSLNICAALTGLVPGNYVFPGFRFASPWAVLFRPFGAELFRQILKPAALPMDIYYFLKAAF
jgi:hypothetical protein